MFSANSTNLELTADEIRNEANRLASELPSLEWRAAEAQAALEATRELARRLVDTLAGVEPQVRSANMAVDRLRAEVQEAAARLAVAERLEPARRRLDELPDLERARRNSAEAKRFADKWRGEVTSLEALLGEARATLKETNEVGGLARRWKRLPAPEAQEARVAELQAELTAAQAGARRLRNHPRLSQLGPR